jgi:hypothetical protein
VFLRTEAPNASKKLRPPTRSHGATNKKAKNSVFTTVKGSNLTFHLTTVCSVYNLYIQNIMHEGTKRRTVLQSGNTRKRKESSIRGNVR